MGTPCQCHTLYMEEVVTNFKPQIDDPELILSQYIWGNSLLTRARTPIFQSDCVNLNIDRVIDIYYFEHRRLYTYEQLVDYFEPDIFNIEYSQVH